MGGIKLLTVEGLKGTLFEEVNTIKGILAHMMTNCLRMKECKHV